jgi:hypothetical protein
MVVAVLVHGNWLLMVSSTLRKPRRPVGESLLVGKMAQETQIPARTAWRILSKVFPLVLVR